MPILPINITSIQGDETNVNWVEDGELANDVVLNRPIKDISVVVNTIISTVNESQSNVNNIAALRELDPVNSARNVYVIDIEDTYTKRTAVAGTYTDNGTDIIIPTDGDGSVGWLLLTRKYGTESDQVPLNSDLPISSTTVQGLVQLTDSVISTSTTTAATPNSVKSAYERGTTGINDASNAQTTADAALVEGTGSAQGRSNSQNDSTFLGIDANAVSASVLETARTITLSSGVAGSVSFDGSDDVSISVTVPNNGHVHTTPQIGTATAGLSGYAVGSYIFATSGIDGDIANYGETFLGSNLRPAGVARPDASGSGNMAMVAEGLGFGGTWRCMGNAKDFSDWQYKATLWLRIS